MQYILGIETSCDDTGIALVALSDVEVVPVRGDDTGSSKNLHRPKLLAERKFSQTLMHREYGGVVPELASRDHIRRLLPFTQQVCQQAGVSLDKINAIAVTYGPGLGGALMVGAAYAHALAAALKVPVIPVHHLEAHMLTAFLSEVGNGFEQGGEHLEFPFLCLLVSGGHTQLLAADALGAYCVLGDTLDDAAGEAFDKCAKLLGLPYPGGPEIAALAHQARSLPTETGNTAPKKPPLVLPRPLLHSKDLNFSFSGLKTALAVYVRKHYAPDLSDMSQAQRCQLALAVEEAIVDVLVAKTKAASHLYPQYRHLVLAGGVAANEYLRQSMAQQPIACVIHYPPVALCSDNGVMVALTAALYMQRAGLSLAHNNYSLQGSFMMPCSHFSGFDIRPRWPLASRTGSCHHADAAGATAHYRR